jgi:hypothetical protein
MYLEQQFAMLERTPELRDNECKRLEQLQKPRQVPGFRSSQQ